MCVYSMVIYVSENAEEKGFMETHPKQLTLEVGWARGYRGRAFTFLYTHLCCSVFYTHTIAIQLGYKVFYSVTCFLDT